MKRIDLKSLGAGLLLGFAVILCVAASGTERMTMEFQIVVGDVHTGQLRNEMNRVGRDGWEFVSTSGVGERTGYAVFRRPTPARDSATAEEKRTALPNDDLKNRFIGAWQLESFADGRVSEANVGELKFVGDRHWSVSRLDPKTKRLEYHMGGTYKLNGDEYVETIEFANDPASEMIGQEFTYKIKIEGETFTQIGQGNPYSLIFKRAK